MEPLHVDSALAGLRRLLERIAGPDVDLVVEADGGLPPVRFEERAFRLVVVELVRVASESNLDRGRIAVHASAEPGSGSVRLTVADSGAESAEAGLAAVRDVVAANGGAIEVVATPGGGSTFSIYLPAWT